MDERIIVVCALAVLLVFPLFFGFDIVFFGSDKSVFFTVKLFGITISKGKLILSEDKKGLKPYKKGKFKKTIEWKKFFTVNTAIKPFSDYTVASVKTNFLIGDGINSVMPFMITFFWKFVSEYLEWFFSFNKPYLKIQNRTFIEKNSETFDFNIKITVLFNILMLLIGAIKILAEKIIYGTKRGKQNKQSC